MKTSEEKKQIKKQFKTIHAHIRQYVKSPDQEELHHFRVAIKKLKAFLVLLQSHSHNRHLLGRFKPVRKIFKKAGDIRGAHINLKLSGEYQLESEEFINRQHQLMDASDQTFRKNGKQYIKALKQAKKNILQHIHGVNGLYIKDFYNENINSIAAYLQKLAFDASLHDCRKKIKFLLYNYKTANESVNHHLNYNTAYLDELQESIGNWHDNMLVLELARQVDPENKTTLHKLKRKNAALQKQIATLCNNFMPRVTGIEDDIAILQPS